MAVKTLGISNQYFESGLISYRYAFNGMEGDDELKGEGNSYTTEFRQYDPRLGRWLSIDMLSDLQPAWTPYKAFLNSPLIYTDVRGLTEEERMKALRAARQFVDANPVPSKSSYGFAGYHKGTPGKAIDCSGLVSQSAWMAGFGYLNSIPTTGPHKKSTSLNGVGNIINQPLTRKVDINDIVPGNIITMSNRVVVDGIPAGHVGFVDNIKRDKEGNVIGFTMVHSAGSSGPVETEVDLNDPNDYYSKNFGDGFNYWAWDTPEEVTEQPETIKKPAPLKNSKPNSSEESSSNIFMDAIKWVWKGIKDFDDGTRAD